MNKKKIFLLDKNNIYLQGISGFIKNNHSNTVDVESYTDIEILTTSVFKGSIADVLVVDKDLYIKELDTMGFKAICILSNTADPLESITHKIIQKYQPGPKIYDEIVQAYKDSVIRKQKEIKVVQEKVTEKEVTIKEDNKIQESLKAKGIISDELKDLLYSDEDILLISKHQDYIDSLVKIIYAEGIDLQNKSIVKNLESKSLFELYTKIKKIGSNFLYTVVSDSLDDYLDILEFNLVVEYKLPIELVKKMIKKSIKKVILISNDSVIIKEI